jgi:hypothetical protein
MTTRQSRTGRLSRAEIVARLRAHLEASTYPRLQMLFIVSAAALLGFLASAALLALGLQSLAVRYGLAALIAYLGFLGLLRLWLSRCRSSADRLESDHLNPLDAADLAEPIVSGLSGVTRPAISEVELGLGGRFGGGGASRLVDTSASAHGVPAVTDLGVPDVDLDDGWPILAAIVILVALAGAMVGAVIVVAGAPTLLAEVLLDALIAGAAYRRLRHLEPGHWLGSAVRRTWKPMLAILLALVIGGGVAQRLRPSADSIGDFFVSETGAVR